MKYFFFLIFIFPQFSFAEDTLLTASEQEQKVCDAFEKATTNVQAWIHGIREDAVNINDSKSMGIAYFDIKKDPDISARDKLYSKTYPGNFEVYDAKVDTDIPGIVYLTTTPDHLPHMIIYFQSTEPATNYPRIFKEMLSNAENNSFQLVVTRVIDCDTQQENSQVIKVMAKDLKLKRPSDNVAIDLKELLCPIVEPGLGDKAWAFMSGKTPEPTHTDCL